MARRLPTLRHSCASLLIEFELSVPRLQPWMGHHSPVAVDPSGRGLAILSWLTYWPLVAVLLGGITIILITSVGAGAVSIAVAWTLIASGALVYMLGRDPVET